MARQSAAYDDDAPELTDAELAEFQPAREIMYPHEFEAAAAVRKGRPKAETRKVSVTFRLDPEVVAGLRATGSGWQTRANTVLGRSVGITVTSTGGPAKQAGALSAGAAEGGASKPRSRKRDRVA